MLSRVLVPVACVLLVVAADDAQTDRKNLQGAWFMTAYEKEGSRLPAALIRANTLAVEGGRWVYRSENLGYETKITFELHPTSSPRGIDMTETIGGKGRLTRGIYKIEGDTLTICRPAGNGAGPRPKRFSGEDRGVVLMVWKRAKR